jgi:hypothetical protein
MSGSASKNKPAHPFGVYVSAGGCPTLSHMSGAGGTAKRRADWALVSGVSPVSPNLKLIERIQREKVGYGRKGINWPQGPCAETGGTGATVTRVCGETAGAGHAWDRWDPSKRGQGARVRRSYLVTRLRGSPRLALILGGSSNALPIGSHRG